MTIKVKLFGEDFFESLEEEMNEFLKGIRDDDVRSTSIFRDSETRELIGRIEYKDRKKGEALSSKTDIVGTGLGT